MIKELIQSKIYEISGQKVMFDFDLSTLYNVETRTLKQAVRRNIKRFPKDFLVELSKEEWSKLITDCDKLPETAKYSPSPPFVFTEQGVAMLSTVLKSEKAIQVNIAIMRAFVFIRQYALNHQDLTEKLNDLEEKCNKKFLDIFDAIKYLLKKEQEVAEHNARKRIGFQHKGLDK